MRNNFLVYSIWQIDEQIMMRRIFRLLCISMLLVFPYASRTVGQTIPDTLQDSIAKARIMRAYPHTIMHITGDTIAFRSGKTLLYGQHHHYATYDAMLDSATMRDQMRGMIYPVGTTYDRSIPFRYDSSRIRCTDFFRLMYGTDQHTIEKHLTTVQFFGTSIRITTVNNVAEQLRAVERELRALPDSLHRYCRSAVGGYAYRSIAGTNRMSMHSFGIALDLNLQYSHYWLWEKPNQAGQRAYKNRIPLEIVEVFEKYGFIWGGKWWHFDTMHFEYRPELLPAAVIVNKK